MAKEETPHEYWKLNRSKDIDIFHDSISGVTLTHTQVVRLKEGSADFSSRFVQAKQFGHIIPATAVEYKGWLKFRWESDNPGKEYPEDTDSISSPSEALPLEEELADLTKPELLDRIKKDKSITKAQYNSWLNLSSEEIILAYLEALQTQ